MSENIKRVRLLKLWEILSSETDEEHPLDTEALLSRLTEMGIPCFRTTLYDDIKTLQKYGYEIFCNRGKRNAYYAAEQAMSVPEVLILLDAVQAASFISQKKTEEFVNKLSSLAGREKAKVLKRNIVEFTVAKSPNEHILYAVNEISQAILNKRKISFHYFDYDSSYQRCYRMSKKSPEKKRGYKVNPLGTVFDGGYYYLFCYDDFFGGISHYRVDRMDEVKMIEEEISITADNKKAELSERKRQLFSMFGGDVKHVEFHADKDLIDVIYDKFGQRIKMYELNEQEVAFSAEVQVSPTFIAWCCAFGSKLKVVSPIEIVKEMRRYVEELHEMYKEKSSP